MVVFLFFPVMAVRLSAMKTDLPGNEEVIRTVDAQLSAQEEEILHMQARMLLGALPKAMPGRAGDTTAQVALGQKLYFEKSMSLNNSQSCNDCHPVQGKHAGADNKPTSPGAQKQFGARNAPTVLNAGFQHAQFWDGRSPDLADQAKGPILNPVEMGMSKPEDVMQRLASAGYKPLFAKAFPGGRDAFTYDNVGKAIAAFERTLVSRSRFDAYIEGNRDGLQPLEKRGLMAFLDVGCVRCHGGPMQGGLLYQKIGVFQPYGNAEDLGRFDVTKSEKDRFVFKVPLLRNISMTGPYYHDGTVATLAEAIDRMAWLQLGTTLSSGQIDGIMRFLTALADERRSADTPVARASSPKPWSPAAFSSLKDDPRAEDIIYGFKLLSDTPAYLGQDGLGYSGNKLACRNCHQEAGTKLYGLPWMGVTKRYPTWRGRDGREITLEDRINDCMRRSLAGRPLPTDGREMRAMVAYMTWLTEQTPKENQGLLLVKFSLPDRAADPAKGKEVYTLYCQNCHGDDGQGYQAIATKKNDSLVAPPLWGDSSYNIGAGMNRLLTATPFIHANMPLGVRSDAPALSIEEAYDAAAYVNSQSRLGMEGLEADWPDKTTKNIDAPYGPYADPFPSTQHTFGPFKPIEQWKTGQKKAPSL